MVKEEPKSILEQRVRGFIELCNNPETEEGLIINKYADILKGLHLARLSPENFEGFFVKKYADNLRDLPFAKVPEVGTITVEKAKELYETVRDASDKYFQTIYEKLEREKRDKKIEARS